MNVPDLQNSTTKKARISKEITDIVKIGLQHTSHGFITYIGFAIINFYLMFLGMNLVYGNRLAFNPGLMLLSTPLLLIIIGALNSYSMKFIYHRRTSQHWAGLLGQGFLVGLLGFLISLFWTTILIALFGYSSAYGWFFVEYYILLVPTLGYITREVSVYFTGIALEESSKDE